MTINSSLEKVWALERELKKYREDEWRYKKLLRDEIEKLFPFREQQHLGETLNSIENRFLEALRQSQALLKTEYGEKYLNEREIRLEAQSAVIEEEMQLRTREEAVKRKTKALNYRQENVQREIEAQVGKNSSEFYDELLKDFEQKQSELKNQINHEQQLVEERAQSLIIEAQRLERGWNNVSIERQSLASRLAKMKARFPSQQELHRQIRHIKGESDKLTQELSIAQKKLASQKKQAERNRQLKKDNTRLEEENIQQTASIERLERTVNRRKRESEKQKLEILRLSDNSPVFTISSEKIADWFVEGQSQRRSIFPDDLVTIGSGPIDAYWFNNRLEELGFSVWEGYEDCSHIIVGRENWESSLDEVVDFASVEGLYVYSQELFIASYCLNEDLFELEETELLLEFSKGHPALEYLMKSGFEWPEIVEPLPDEPTKLETVGWLDKSPLTDFGYHVGRTAGLPVARRKTILRSVFQNKINWMYSDEYMADWGEPRSRKRLWRMAHHLAWLIRFRANIANQAFAIQDWRTDLKWLKAEFYQKTMRFNWPYT